MPSRPLHIQGLDTPLIKHRYTRKRWLLLGKWSNYGDMQMISHFRLTYFSGRGVAERIRYLLAEAGVEYEEIIITKELLAQLRARGDLLFQQLPYLEIDGLKLIQSGAIQRYLARKYELYGKNNKEATLCDMVNEGLKDFLSKAILPYPFQSNKKEFVESTLAPSIPRYMGACEGLLRKNNNGESKGFILGDHISYPDLFLLETLEYINEIVPEELCKYPLLTGFRERMIERPSIKKFYVKGHYPLPDAAYAAHVAEVLEWN